MALELNFYPITPIIKGTYPQGTPLGKICLQNIFADDEHHSRGFRLVSIVIPMTNQFLYALFFYLRIRTYVKRYGQKLCAIGNYKRNCKTLKTSMCCACLGCFFPIFNYTFRYVISSDTFAQFFAHFLFVDVCIDLFYIGLFLFAAKDDVPSMEETPRRTLFYVSKPKHLEPRRPESVFPILTRIDGMNSTEPGTCNNQIPLVRVTRDGHRVTLYQATFEKKVGKEHFWLRGPTVKVPKLAHVSPLPEELQVEAKTGKPEKKIPSTVEKVLQQQDTKSLTVDSLLYCNIGDVELLGTPRFQENKQSSKNVLSLDYDAIERVRGEESGDQSCDLPWQSEKKISTRAGRFNYLKQM